MGFVIGFVLGGATAIVAALCMADREEESIKRSKERYVAMIDVNLKAAHKELSKHEFRFVVNNVDNMIEEYRYGD